MRGILTLCWLAAALIAACGGEVTGGSAGQDGAAGADGGAPNSLFERVRDACASGKAAGCTDDCDAVLTRRAQGAVDQGCVNEFSAALDCGSAIGSFCGHFASFCHRELYALLDCGSPVGCETIPGSAGCEVACSGWSAACERNADAVLSCTCTTGPHKGSVYVVGESCELGSLSDALENLCGPTLL